MLLDGTSIDVTFVPMAISYDKVLEAETFPQELLGEPKKAEEYLVAYWNTESSLQPLLGALQQSTVSPMAQFHNLPPLMGQPCLVSPGKGETVQEASRSEQQQQLDPTHPKSYPALRAGGKLPPISQDLKRKVVCGVSNWIMDKLSEGLYVTPTALVCTILALHRDGIREEDLVSVCNAFRREGNVHGVGGAQVSWTGVQTPA
ncbi:uncharacterized protein LOC113147422 [Cyclospora cayetanensis]|uniref:Uncharacterized protein LOC113147422 n=1 Tax=Cyclospora cayetanensis TaxID=88456 RepID=A0A6P6S0P9_9EIME|nr:uncharacterized protein LOC113147422 [Cyclospora cayetanensis]